MRSVNIFILLSRLANATTGRYFARIAALSVVQSLEPNRLNQLINKWKSIGSFSKQIKISIKVLNWTDSPAGLYPLGILLEAWRLESIIILSWSGTLVAFKRGDVRHMHKKTRSIMIKQSLADHNGNCRSSLIQHNQYCFRQTVFDSLKGNWTKLKPV